MTPARPPTLAEPYECVDFQTVLREGIRAAGGDAAFARAAGVGLPAVWEARDDHEPHPRILWYLKLAQVTYTFRTKQ